MSFLPAERVTATARLDVERAQERGVRFRVLLLDHCAPEPDKDAGSNAVLHLIRILQHFGGKVTFIPEGNYLHLDRYTADLQRAGVECLYAPFVTSVKQHLESTRAPYDLVVLYRYLTGKRHLSAIRRLLPQAKVILLDVDAHFLREQRETEIRQDAAIRARAESIKREELEVIRRVDHAMVHSTVERDLLAAACPEARVEVFGWVTDPPIGTTALFEDRRDLVFIGDYRHPPNVDAVLYLVREVLRLVKARLPDVWLHVVGSHPPAPLRALESEHVLVTGFVPDLGRLLDRIRVAVVPLRFGAGVEGKIATAMSRPATAASRPRGGAPAVGRLAVRRRRSLHRLPTAHRLSGGVRAQRRRTERATCAELAGAPDLFLWPELPNPCRHTRLDLGAARPT